MNYTKGPWTFRPNPCECNDCTASHWIDGPPDAPGATLGKPIAEVREYHKGESEANARLIAAAPDLADQLADVLKHLHEALFYINYPSLAMPAEKFDAASEAEETAGRLLKATRGAETEKEK